MKYFRVGTCRGIYTWDNSMYAILSIVNEKEGNGHFNDVIEWFENSCKRDKKDFQFLHVWNEKLKNKLINKYGFENFETEHLIKRIKVLLN